MKQRNYKSIIIIFLVILCGFGSFVKSNLSYSYEAGSEYGPQSGLNVSEVKIKTLKKNIKLKVEIAQTMKQQEIGMMWRTKILQNNGMLFPYKYEQMLVFWMHNTLIPLDIIFIRADGTIVKIYNAKALDDTPLSSMVPVIACLEIGGGEAKRLNIQVGDKVFLPPNNGS